MLAEDVVATEAMPPFAASSVDGYAVVAADGPGPRRLVGDQVAGVVENIRIEPGTAARVTTGAPVPPGADAVVMVEFAEAGDGVVEILESGTPVGANVRPVGQDIQPGQRVLAKGTLLGPAELGLLGTVGRFQVPVFR
ncbi:MAG: molybdopterin molybdenumtransferase MoeA, partial [Chloroflexi bacterium]